MTPIVKVTAYKGILIIEGPDPDFKSDDWVPAGPGKIGCVLMDTEKNLGVSKEALELLGTVGKTHDSLGDVMWWQAGERECFGWLGPSHRLMDPSTSEGDREYRLGKHITIPNEPPEGAVQALDVEE